VAKTPEGKVKDYLVERIRKLGGEVRFLKWIGRHGAPDTLVMLKDIPPTFVETKAPEEKPRPSQVREFERLRHYGFRVLVVDSEEQIDHEFPDHTPGH
jgi:hypothetical protein